MLLATLFTFFLVALNSYVQAITVTTSTAAYTINTGSSYGFTAVVSRTTCDVTSLNFYGTEFQSTTASGIASGLGTGTTVSYKTSGIYVIVSCVQNNADFDLTHYMVFADLQSTIYMGTYTVTEPTIGELRYIMRLAGGLTETYPVYLDHASDISGGTAIEATDVYLVGTETRSKFYSSERFIDDNVYCATNTAASIHGCWVRPTTGQGTEKSSGGPFFRDIDLNEVGTYQSSTYYMNSGHVQTEAYRQGFHGPYIFTFSRSGIPTPASFDVSFFDGLGLTGYIPTTGRGKVTGKASGVSTSFPVVVHWTNANYQYWAYASSLAYTSPAMVPGTYTMNLYQDELLAASQSVVVTAGGTLTSNIAATNAIIIGTRTTIFKMGDYDGQPTGFLNADKQLRMHPSDARMSSWSPGTVASTNAAGWPMAMWLSVNNGQKISFTMAATLATTATLRIGTTLAFAGGRPQAIVNGYTCPAPAAPVKIDSRGVTRGAYRGYGEVYTCVVPASTLVAGANTVTINVISGSSGVTYLSPNVIFDFIELYH